MKKMPGKQDPEYFPLNLNTMNGGLGFYGEVNPILIPHRHHGKFDSSAIVHHGSPIGMALHNSPVNATMSDYMNNMNGLPLNSEDDEEEDDDDIVSQSGSESVSVQGSDLDLEVMDDVDSLVLNIRDKLRMAAPQFNLHSSHSNGEYWTDSSATSTPNSIHSTASNIETDRLILPQQRSSSTTNSSNNKTSSSHQRKRRGTLNARSSGSQWRHSHPTNSNNSYYKQFHANQSGSISKSKKTSSFHQSHWWSSRSFSDLSKQSRSKEAYHLLQELIQSGTLISEAVRRLNRNCLNSPNNGSSNQEPIAPSNSAASLVVSSTKFSYMDEDSENNFNTSHHHSSLKLSAPCN